MANAVFSACQSPVFSVEVPVGCDGVPSRRTTLKEAGCQRSVRLLAQRGLFPDTRSLVLSKNRVLSQSSLSRRPHLRSPQCVTASPTVPATTTPTKSWDTQLYVHGCVKKPPLTIQIVDADTGNYSGEPVTISTWKTSNWERNPSKDGTILSGKLSLPDSIKNPGAVVLKYTGPKTSKPENAAVYVSEVVLSVPGRNVTFSAHSWVHRKHTDGRVFFEGIGRLPTDTPDALKPFRQKELDIIKGEGSPDLKERRTVGDRIIDYDVYNDLSDFKGADGIRPPLGQKGVSVYKYAYPRRLATNRGLTNNGKDVTADGLHELPTKLPTWIPQDDSWDPTKSCNFNGDAVFAFLPSLASIATAAAAPPYLKFLQKVLGRGIVWTIVSWLLQLSIFTPIWTFLEQKNPELFDKDYANWGSFDEVDRVFNPDSEDSLEHRLKAQSGGNSVEEIATLGDEIRKSLLAKRGVTFTGVDDEPDSVYQELVEAYNDLFKFQEPYVWLNRNEQWMTDEEFGRQYLAGQNPFTLKALKDLPVAPGSALNADVVKPFLEGNDLSALVADAKSGGKPRVFWVDYWEPYKTYAPSINIIGQGKLRHQYAGRTLFYLKNDGLLRPVAIELWSAPEKPTDDPAGKVKVYTPNDHPNVWVLAKTVFNSLDSGYHQLVSHWLRTHCVLEPYQIATYRCLSTMHPVYKFILPHFLYTFRINGNARSSLINAGGVIEEGFTPGKYSIELSAVAYDLLWFFDQEALPADLIHRGLAKEGENGKLELLVDDYPYVEDAVLIWDAIESWAKDYVNEYYKNDEAVRSDHEVQAWWNEIREKGHADKKDGWINLDGRASLTRILATIAWVASGHHAAVNFGQYDYSGYPLNRTALIRRPIPEPGTPAYEELTSSKRSKFQSAFTKVISNPFPALQIMTTIEILSSHAENEHYLSDTTHGLLYDGSAIRLHEKFVQKIRSAEEEIKKRNAPETAKPTRKALPGGKGGLPYTLLVPTSGKGATGQGIPYSVSI